jgi:hypothetical protein
MVHTHEVRLYIVHFTYFGRVILITVDRIYGIWGNMEGSYSWSTPVYSVIYVLWKCHAHNNRLYIWYMRQYGMYILMKFACILCTLRTMEGSYSWQWRVYKVYEAVWKGNTRTVRLYIVYFTYYGRVILMKYSCILCTRGALEDSCSYSPRATLEGFYSYIKPVYSVYVTLWKGHTHIVRLYIACMWYYGMFRLKDCTCI